MKVLVLGGCQPLGAKVVGNLRQLGYPVVADADPRLPAALHGIEVLIDLREPPVVDTADALEDWARACRQLNAAIAAAAVAHHIALSALGVPRLQSSNYYQALALREQLIQAGSTPFTVLRAAPLYESLAQLAHNGAAAAELTIPVAQMQPMAAEDLAMLVVDAALARPLAGCMDVAGPQKMAMADWVQQYLRLQGDPRVVLGDADVPYQGALLDDDCLVPAGPARLGRTTLAAWICKSRAV
ncbi:Rossmann-fold NAD(P)-binding domain-containing protein [Comamonas koreensis]|uniref:NmrA family transcriptional regulator n=1 Tax=Comamonas koreensis TaxID=160825 RepID=A0AAW4XZD1_9BURK|nr:NmrA family transcriptional regulator [Comamonas koreensis]MCD2166780.1 NmrA family transcriptional regulator [Comamonas koreensis]